MARAPRKKKVKKAPAKEPIFGSREYWWSRTPLERLAALEELRQKKYCYTAETPLKFVRVMRIRTMGQDDDM